MKRADAFRKLRTICKRLDRVDSDFPLKPIRLYLFGSMLSDKPEPHDIDLLLHAEIRLEFISAAAAAVVQGARGPVHKAGSQLRRGMQMVRIHDLGEESPFEWFRVRGLPAEPVVLVWENGVDWSSVVDRVEASPLQWDAAAEARRKAEGRMWPQLDALQQAIIRSEASERGSSRAYTSVLPICAALICAGST